MLVLVLLLLLVPANRVSSAPLEARKWSPPAPAPESSAQKQLRSESPPITWIRAHPAGQSPCAPEDTTDSPDGQTIEHVWCFEGAAGDSTWPAIPAGQNNGTRHDAFDHWSLRDQPDGTTPWHVTSLLANPHDPSNAYNAWCGCDVTEGLCPESALWGSGNGYGNDWNQALILDCTGHDASGGGTIRFDLRYDTECLYDYAVLEAEIPSGSGTWVVVQDSQGNPAYFSGTSGVSTSSCTFDYFGYSANSRGASSWLNNVVFPIPAGITALRLRWRALSDLSISDEDQTDTDGLVAVDDVVISFADGSTVADDFATGDFTGVQDTGPHSSASAWSTSPVGNPYDGWHLQFDPSYMNKGNSCLAPDDWMWAAKPSVGAIPTSGFDYFLVTPVFSVVGWTGGMIEYSEYFCMPDVRDDYIDRNVRVFDRNLGWMSWQSFDPWIHFGGCVEWEFNRTEDLTPFLGATVDSVQVAWEILDGNVPGDFGWGKHGNVQYLIDNVSIGVFDVAGTYFTANDAELLQDTFSLADPAHSASLRNNEQGKWVGSGGSRSFAADESLSVDVQDQDGVTEGNVVLWWRHDDGGAGFGSWSGIPMDLAVPSANTQTDEGLYRALIGADDGGVGDLTPSGDGLIWLAGTTVQYYVKATDDVGGASTFPAGAMNPSPSYFDFSVLPMFRTGPSQSNETYLLVNDTGRPLLDFESSDVSGPVWSAVYAPAAQLTECGVQALGIQYDRYDVYDNLEPPGKSKPASDIGGYMDAAGLPLYDCLIWIHGDLGDSTFSAASRTDLRSFLDNGGLLFAAGDGIASDLSVQDPSFLSDYLGAALSDSLTDAYVLNARGEPGTSLDGIVCGLFGNCPTHRYFDRLSPASPIPGQSSEVIMTYRDGAPTDEGETCVIRNVPASGPGMAVFAGFDLSAMLSCDARTCLLGTVLADEFGRTIPVPATCVGAGVSAPAIAPGAAGFSLGQALPNPFSSRTLIRFSVPRAGPVTLVLYDVQGRRVRTLLDDVLDSAEYTRAWDGRSTSGALVANGMYFYRLTTARGAATGRVVLVR
jgi:hypothetical protein